MLPSKYIAVVMFGYGLSGMTINILRGICLLSFSAESDPFYGVLVYFIVSAIILVICSLA